jgi:hypothetical protein
MADKLTEEMIEEGMAQAEKVGCRPGDDRCCVFPGAARGCAGELDPEGRLSAWLDRSE